MKNFKRYLENKFVYSYPSLKKIPIINTTMLGETICAQIENVGVVIFPSRAYGEKERIRYFFSIYDLINFHNVKQKKLTLERISYYETLIEESTEKLEALKKEIEIDSELAEQYKQEEIALKKEKYSQNDTTDKIADSVEYYNKYLC